MKKIITAINNPKLNEELKKENNFEIIGKDIQYKEAILETLEKNNNIDLIIISEKIPGEIKFEKLIEKIKIKNEKMKIIVILEKTNDNLEKILIKNNIKDIYYNNKINLEELIKIINKKEMNMEEEIIKLKKIIEEKNIKEEKKEKKIQRVKNKIESFLAKKLNKVLKKNIEAEKRNTNFESISTKVITFSGNNKSGKTTLSLIISHSLTEKNKKVLLIDADFEKQDLSIILEQEKNFKNKNYNFYPKNKLQKKKSEKNRNVFFINRTNHKNKFKYSEKRVLKLNKNFKKIVNSKNKIYYYEIKTIIKNNIKIINHNLYLFNGLNSIFKNKLLKKEKILKKMVYLFFKIIKEKYDFIIIDLSKNNGDIINKQILKNSYTNFVLLEPNLLGVREIQKLLYKYIFEWRITKNSLFIIESKKNFISMNKRLILKLIPIKNKIFEIKENKFYCILLNRYYKRKILIKNKIIKNDLNKIINKILIK